MTVLQPFLLLSYFFLHFWSENVIQKNVFRAIFHYYVLSVIAVLFIFWILFRWTRSLRKSSLITSILLTFFFLYGHFFYLLKQYVLGRLDHPHILALLTILALAGIFSILRAEHEKLGGAVRYCFFLSVLLLITPILNLLFHTVYKPVPEVPLYEYTGRLPQMQDTAEQLPDIYFIVLDEYARHDVLKDYYDYDNEEFLRFLKDHGFFVAADSYSNYNFSLPSLASTLNMNYVHDSFSTEEEMFTRAPQMIQKNRLVRFLKKLGYRYITVDSGVHNMTGHSPEADSTIRYEGATEVDLAFFNTTLLRLFGQHQFAESWRRRHLYNFKELKKVPLMQSPKFVFAHILLPHPPFVFDYDGRLAKSYRRVSLKPGRLNIYDKLYLDQLIYTNRLTEDLILDILKNSKKTPVIVLESDHGVESKGDDLRKIALTRHSNLMAIYFPGGRYEKLSERMTPVNIFRIILDQFFHTRMGKLEDKVYYNIREFCNYLGNRDTELLCWEEEPEPGLVVFKNIPLP